MVLCQPLAINAFQDGKCMRQVVLVYVTLFDFMQFLCTE